MIIFCDTNIILEVLEERSNYKFVEEILLSNESSNTLYLSDGYQYEAARHCGADVLLTINKKDFVSVHNADLLVLTPEEYISKYLRNGIDG